MTLSHRLFFIVYAITISASSSAAAGVGSGQDFGIDVAVASASSGAVADAYKVLSDSGMLRFGSGQQFAKFEIHFATPVSLTQVEVRSCGKPLSEGIELFVDFDRKHVFSEGGKSRFLLTLAPSNAPLTLSSLTLNLRYNAGACLASVRFFKGTERLQVRVPELLESSKAVPIAVFDARLETTWGESDAGNEFDLEFPKEIMISGLRVWNGDQRSPEKFHAAPRVKTLILSSGASTARPSGSETAGEEYREIVQLEDRPGAQVVELRRPFKGRELKIKVGESFGSDKGKGQKKAGRAILSELQFKRESTFSSVDVGSGMRVITESRRAGFRTANLEHVLDRSLVFRDERAHWIVRLRSDGSVFMKGHSDNLREAGIFTFLGLYQILDASSNGVQLSIDGARLSGSRETDSSVCGRRCAGRQGVRTSFIRDRISIGRAKGAEIFVRDEGQRGARSLSFRSTKMKIMKSDD